MRTSTKVFLLTSLGALLGAAGCRGPREQVRDEPREEQARPTDTRTREGILTDVGRGQLTIRLVDRTRPLTVEIDPTTPVILDDERVSHRVLNEGLPVRVVLSEMEPVNGNPRAERIEVLSGREAADVQRQLR
jgi:hypothetical protein